MKIFLITLVFLIVVWFLYRNLYVKRKSRQKAAHKLRAFEHLLGKLTKHDTIKESDVLPLANNASTRHALFGILNEFGRTDIFPKSYFTLQKSAESFLVNWLEFPTELSVPPDAIEFFTAVTLEEAGESIEYFVFKYRKAPPQKGFSEDWMLGVAGPFGPESKPYDIPERVFSRFNGLGTVSPLEEVRWVHEHINRK